MSRTEFKDMTNWEALSDMSDEEALANALNDPDNLPNKNWKRIQLNSEDGDTMLERIHIAMEREKRVPLTYTL